MFLYCKRVDKERLSYRQCSYRGDSPGNHPGMFEPLSKTGVREMAVMEIIPKHPLAFLKPQRSSLLERPLGKILQKNKTIEKYGHLLEAGAADERESNR